MKDSEVLTQLAEAKELLTLLEHLSSAYGKQQQARPEEGASAAVAWQGLRFNLRECRKRVVAAQRLIESSDREAADGQAVNGQAVKGRLTKKEATSRPSPSRLTPTTTTTIRDTEQDVHDIQNAERVLADNEKSEEPAIQIDQPVATPREAEPQVRVPQPELSPLAKRIRRAPTSASVRPSANEMPARANDTPHALRASGAEARSERAGSVRELRPLASVEKEYDDSALLSPTQRMAE